jgi:hypothetical protein
MSMISSIQPSDNSVVNLRGQQWPDLTSSLQADSKGQWSLAQKVGIVFLFVFGAWVLSRVFSSSHTVTTNSSRSSPVDRRSTNTTVNKGRIEFSNGPSSLPRITDAGVVKQEERKIASFEAIELNVPGHFTIVEGGKSAKIAVSADQNIFNKLQDIVSARKLTIQAQPNTSFETKQPIKYTIVVPKTTSLKEIRVSAASQVTIPYLDSEEFRCTVEDAGKVNVRSGQVQKQEITVNGAGSYDARSLLTQQTIVVINEVGNAHVKARESLNVNIRAAGICTYYGIVPQFTEEKVSLTGRLVFQIDMPEA